MNIDTLMNSFLPSLILGIILVGCMLLSPKRQGELFESRWHSVLAHGVCILLVVSTAYDLIKSWLLEIPAERQLVFFKGSSAAFAIIYLVGLFIGMVKRRYEKQPSNKV